MAAANQKDAAVQPYGYGDFSGLHQPATRSMEGITKLASKIDDFKQLRLVPDVRSAIVKELTTNSVCRDINSNHLKPTEIQAAAIKIMQEKRRNPEELRTFVLSAETGSGKTWAYLAPMLSKLKEDELAAGWDIIKDKQQIRAVVLVPTHELLTQVYGTLAAVSEDLGLNVFKWGGGTPYNELFDKLEHRIDVMVTTPNKLKTITTLRRLNSPLKLFQQVKYIAVDEADTLMDKSWVEDTYDCIQLCPNTTDLVFVSATIPREFNRTVEKLFPVATPIATAKIHKIPKSIDFKVIDAAAAPYKGSRNKALAQILYAIHKDGTEQGFEKRVLIFVNEKKDIEKLGELLVETYGHDVTTIMGGRDGDSADTRGEKIALFLNPPRRLEDIGETGEIQSQLKVLVTTDVLARGLNFHGIKNVVLYHVPNTSIDLVHRAGRTGRMNTKGRVFMIVNNQDKGWVKGLPAVVKKQIPLA
ncbi:hypothetical protein BABINDRAFT_169987 [Babjeviella inositovora NRRL Y-12698]|uniref:RNA helicase n=1 Tax=Babjeviella inositovora NRRL Y-12698 TaxID=984486 RepID=A0A1E3QYS9_9ASCO|nr:uncharacterized protein BABINDRAFT_169987 [Babjeviella inositovora NRRL Y-12698]ODQ82839.1 hypothetical protein BABINDRAFT_169987 [Babjeviella inositovora NRRL Y-12698]